MDVRPLHISGPLLITPKRHQDGRGFFAETYSRRQLQAHGIDHEFVQDNHSLSLERGTVRGLHFQAPPHAQAKLVRCGRGAIFDVAVDIRRGSPTYGKWVGAELTQDNGCQFYVPEGFAHGFLTLQENSEIVYKCSNYYAPQSEGSVNWSDQHIGIEWPLDRPAIVSDKDADAPLLDVLDTPFVATGLS